MTFYAKPTNRPLALEGWFEKPKNRLFGHVRVKGYICLASAYVVVLNVTYKTKQITVIVTISIVTQPEHLGHDYCIDMMYTY
jgi:hypothetical protein